MGTLGCPLCCQQDFESVGTLREHLIYYIYRPLQCGVCCLHLAGIQEFTHHLRCHMGDELPAGAKLSCSKPTGSESGCQDSPLPLASVAQDGAGADSDAGLGTAHLSDDYSSYMTGSDAANQLLKLREWRLEKLGKNFSRHRASFGKSPGILELSPASGRLHRSSPPIIMRDSIRDRRPSSQNSSYVARSDVLSLNKDINSVEGCDSSATPLSVYGNVGSIEVSDHSVCPQSVEKEVTQQLGFHSPAQPIIDSPVHSHLPESTTSCTIKQIGLGSPLVEGVPSPSMISEDEVLPKNMNFQDYVLPESSVYCDVDVSHQAKSAVSPSLYVSTTQQVASSTIQSSQNKFETVQDYDICGTNFAEPLSKTQVTDNSVTNTEHNEGNRLPLLEAVNSSELSGDACPQYHELQSVSFNKDQGFFENVSRPLDVLASCPRNRSSAIYNPIEVPNKSQSKITNGSYTFIDSHFGDMQDNFSNKTNTYSYLSSNNDGPRVQSEIIDTGEKVMKNANLDNTNLHQDDPLKGVRNDSHFSNAENSSGFHCLAYEDQAGLEGRSEESYSSLVDTKPYLHKKFHHDQERKVLSSTGVDQVTDVSQYINSFQSVLVRKLNGTLSNNIPMSSNICSASMTKPEKDPNQVGLEEPQPQVKEHICEVCHKMFKNLSTFQVHCKEHEKGEDLGSKDLYRKCSKDPCERKNRRKDKFQCDQCSKVFSKSFNIPRHMREVHAVKKSFTCVQCNKSFSSKRHLQEHSGIHKGEKIHKCLNCDHQCYTASGLRTHIQEIHSLSSEQRVHCCEICGEKFAKIYGLKRHTQRKHTGQQLACNICLKNFTCKEDFNKHNKSHLGAGTMKCDSCDKTFTTSWALQRHSKVHQVSPQQFKCNICNLSFTRKDSLVSHLHAHSQKKPFVCHCGKRFVKKSQLKEHQDKHSSVPKYTCSVCKHSFKFKVSLKNHSCKKKIVQTK